MKIAVIGTVMRDEIHTVRGETRESFGGILYNVLALASLTRSSDRIMPFCYLSAEHLEAIRRTWFPPGEHVSSAAMHINEAGTDENVLRYRTASDREEQMTIRTPPLSPAHLSHATECSAILINFINGRELSLELLQQLRAGTAAHIHLDIHNLGKTIDTNGRLVPDALPNWRDWLSQVDTVQANEWEIELLLGFKPETEEQFRRAALALISVKNIRVAAVTIGGRGSVLVHRMTPDGEVHLVRFPAMEIEEVVDTTGCGDCWSAGFVVGLLRYASPLKAGLMATTLSGLNTAGGGLEALKERTGNLMLRAQEAFPDLYQKIEGGWTGDPVPQEEIQTAAAR